MANTIEQLIYVSRATRTMSKRDLERIGRLASEHNNQCEVTGLLLYARGLFLQLLEGDPVVVNTLLEQRIRPDEKHEDMRILYRAPTTERLASAWGMNVLKVEDLAFQISQVRFNELINELLGGREEDDTASQSEPLPNRMIHAFERLTRDPTLVS